jgi:hypothetical protein
LEVNIILDTAVSQYSQIASLREPKQSERNVLHEWIKSTRRGACGFLGRDLGGFQQPSVYEAVHQKDLAILLDSHGEDDLFTKFINGPLLKLYHWFRQHSKVSVLVLSMKLPIPIVANPTSEAPLPVDLENPAVAENRSDLHYYDDREIETVTNILGTIFSSLAPLVSIIVLSFVSSARVRLGLVCVFAFLFSGCLAIATKARRVEIFAATAA